MYQYTFTYYKKDESMLKRDIALRLLFFFLFISTMIWQITNLLIKHFDNSLSTQQLIFSIIIAFTCLTYAAICIAYVVKDRRILTFIKINGQYITTANILPSIKTGSFIKFYQILTLVLNLALTFVLFYSITYYILQVSFYIQTWFFFPVMPFCCFVGYYSSYHIQNEIDIVKTVQEYNSL